MAIRCSTVTVGTAPTLLFKQNAHAGGVVTFTNLDTSIQLNLGDSAVSVIHFGYQVDKGGKYEALFIPYGESMYGICASGSTTITCNVLAVGQA